MKGDIDRKGASKDEICSNSLPLEPEEDVAWCSEPCVNKIRDVIVQMHPCKQRFSRVDVIPLYACGSQRFYRVKLWVDDWTTDSLGPVKEIWKTFYVTLQGAERKIVSIEEDKKKPLEVGIKGKKFMEEFGLSFATKEVVT